MMNVATQIAVALLGCWEPVAGGRAGEVTCVTMGSDASELRVVTISPGAVTTESRLRLDGSHQPVDAGGCTGWESASPSADGERIHVTAEVRCQNRPNRRRSAALLITPTGEWLHAEGSGIATVANVQLQLMRPYLGEVPAEVREAVLASALEARAARERLQRARPTASDLVELAEMGMADPVIDVVVAAGHPKSFALGIGGSAVTELAGGRGQVHEPMQSFYGFGYPSFYYSDLAFFQGCSSRYWGSSYSFYGDPYRCSRYSYYGYDSWRRYGGGYWPGTFPLGPVVIRPIEPSGGRVVKGQGYRRPGTTSSTRSAQPRGSTASTSAGSSRSPSGSSKPAGASSGSSKGGSSSGGTRTAQPRKP